ncbi:Septin-6 [Sorochytrium milnesiophthora]
MPLEYALQPRPGFVPADPYKEHEGNAFTMNGHLGLDMLAGWTLAQSRRKPYQFNIMMVGESGLGKSTFVNTFLHAVLRPNQVIKDLTQARTVTVEEYKYDLEEKGVKVQLTILDTPGFGDIITPVQESVQPLIDYIDNQYSQYLSQERSLERRQLTDSRVHVILYFVRPTTRLRQFDVEAMHMLGERANVVPIIAKADTLTPLELRELKKTILEQMQHYEIKAYPFHYAEDTELIEDVMQEMPLAVIGSTKVVATRNGREVRGRVYRWGTVEVDNEKHCDLRKLQRLVIGDNMVDLIETTNAVHFSSYRAAQLRLRGATLSIGKGIEMKQTDAEVRLMADTYSRRTEEMKREFYAVVKAKEMELRAWEDRLDKRNRELGLDMEEARKRMEREAVELDRKIAEFNR